MNVVIHAAAVSMFVAVGSPVWIGNIAGSGAVPPPWRVVQIDRKTQPTT